jgi:hypothetical protein
MEECKHFHSVFLVDVALPLFQEIEGPYGHCLHMIQIGARSPYSKQEKPNPPVLSGLTTVRGIIEL